VLELSSHTAHTRAHSSALGRFDGLRCKHRRSRLLSSALRTPNGYRFASIEPTGRYEQRTHGALAATGIAGLSPHLSVAGMSGMESPSAMWNNSERIVKTSTWSRRRCGHGSARANNGRMRHTCVGRPGGGGTLPDGWASDNEELAGRQEGKSKHAATGTPNRVLAKLREL
jgi:hypothetical protein